MHDTFLLKRISEALGELIAENNISIITKLRISTSLDSHANKDNLFEQLSKNFPTVVGEWTEIIIDRLDIESRTAIIESIEGENVVQQL